MNDIEGVPPGSLGGGSHLTDERWLSFELRMRKRRLGRCLLRADLAIDDGRLDEARVALDEAREVDPLGEGIDDLAAKLARREAAAAAPLPLELASWRAPEPRRRLRGRALLIASGAVLTISLAAAYAMRGWPAAPAPAPPRVAVSAAGVPAVASKGTSEAPPKPVAPRLMVLHETLNVPVAVPRIVDDPLQMPPRSGPPIADAATEDTSVMRAVNRADPPPIEPPAIEPRRDPAIDMTVPAVSMPPAASGAVAVRSEARVEAPAPPPTPAAAPAPRESTPPRDELTLVRAVLQRYERAYSSLDAAAASTVWPGVDRGALSRAFDALASQQVSLGSCEVAVRGAAAKAVCSGSASWQPKIGGGLRTEPRQWSFDLRKIDGGWRIERALAR